MTERASNELKKEEVIKLWVASQTNIPAARAKPIMLLPTCSVKAYTKFQFLEEIHEQYRSICVQKRGTAGPYVVHVTRNSTKSSHEDCS